MPEKPETVPPAKYVKAVSDQVLVDLLGRLAIEVGHPLWAEIELYKDGQHVEDANGIVTGEGADLHRGRVRLRFRATGVETRFLFFADSVFDLDPRTPAFSGFFVRGDVKDVEGRPCAGFTSWVVKREDSEWLKWL